jgi:hypothetical protein
MDMVIHFPDEIGKKLQEQQDANGLVVNATLAALEKQFIAQELSESSAQGNRGEYASEAEMAAFFSKWSRHEG